MTEEMSRAAGLLASQRLSLSPIFLEPDLRPDEEAEGYELQHEVNRELKASLGGPADHKIGCTTPVMQKFLGIPSPCAGEVFSSTVMQEKGRVQAAAYRKIGVECEMVAILGADIAPSAIPFTAESVAAYVEAIAPGIEIVDDRYLDYRTLAYIPLSRTISLTLVP